MTKQWTPPGINSDKAASFIIHREPNSPDFEQVSGVAFTF